MRLAFVRPSPRSSFGCHSVARLSVQPAARCAPRTSQVSSSPLPTCFHPVKPLPHLFLTAGPPHGPRQSTAPPPPFPSAAPPAPTPRPQGRRTRSNTPGPPPERGKKKRERQPTSCGTLSGHSRARLPPRLPPSRLHGAADQGEQVGVHSHRRIQGSPQGGGIAGRERRTLRRQHMCGLGAPPLEGKGRGHAQGGADGKTQRKPEGVG